EEILREIINLRTDFLENFAKILGDELRRKKINVSSVDWFFPVKVDLSQARTKGFIKTFDEMASSILVLTAQTTGIATLSFDIFTEVSFEVPTINPIDYPFRELYVTNEAQPGKWLYLIVGKTSFRAETITMTPVDIQAQYKTVVASSVTPLAAGGSYLGEWVDVFNYGHISYLTCADVASAVNGVRLQESNDGVTPHYEQSQSTTLQTIDEVNSYYARLEGIPRSRYERMLYVNGGADQSSFSLLCLARVI
ncbi:unnamed protein product, partial [marine sediment metagenome]